MQDEKIDYLATIINLQNLHGVMPGPGLISISPAQISNMARYAEGLALDWRCFLNHYNLVVCA